MIVRTVEYFGFTLDREVEPLSSPFPDELADAARRALVQALLAGETPHPDQGRVRRAVGGGRHYWRRSGGRPGPAPHAGGARESGAPVAERVCLRSLLRRRLAA